MYERIFLFGVEGQTCIMSIEIELLSGKAPDERPLEIVERKGLGHPDTICDLISEAFSVALSQYYLATFGCVLHHNVDNALISAGQSEAAFGGGRILKPFDLYLSGRATAEVEGESIPLTELADAAVHSWFKKNMHALDGQTGFRLHCITRPGSAELLALFKRQREEGSFLANDTSCGVGFSPPSELERVVLAVERGLNDPAFKQRFPETGEDIKVMGLREHDCITLTISCAFIGRYLDGLQAYGRARDSLCDEAMKIARAISQRELAVQVNTADNLEAGDIYLTVSGTSAEAGDDGETGRGNRMNGLITPMRPMCMEAMAGKNPITHVGKLYTAAANAIACAVAAGVPGVSDAECYLVSQIGAPVDHPRLIHVRIRSAETGLSSSVKHAIEDIAAREIARIPDLWKAFLAGRIGVA
jgi:S-adenosylmethionine synthetase